MKDIIIIVLATLSICFAISYTFLFVKVIKLKKSLSKLFIEKTLLQEYIESTKSIIDEKNFEDSVHKENFIKFLSDSRDWAFKYIEDVQFGIKEFVDSVDQDLSYFDEYGEVSSAYPHYEALVRINNAYKKIKKLIPIEEGK
jgi:hypothetical protein